MRCSQSTERNPISSRSHAVCRIKIRSAELGSAAAAAADDKPAVSAAAGDTASASSAGLCSPPPGAVEGTLSLVDLAGRCGALARGRCSRTCAQPLLTDRTLRGVTAWATA
jgi:hypothetical protein